MGFGGQSGWVGQLGWGRMRSGMRQGMRGRKWSSLGLLRQVGQSRGA